jgi:hypothetical protein
MARYLLVLSKVTSLPALIVRAQLLAATQARTTFVLITPLPRTTQDNDVAKHLASANDIFAVTQLRRARLNVERSEIGDRAPLLAIEDELRAHPGAYDAVLLASPAPRRVGRLLALDDHWRSQSLPIPVIHVFEGGDIALPTPLASRARRAVAGPAGIIRWVARLLQRPRLGLAVLMAPMVAYLTLGAMLAVFVDRRFLINETLAFAFYSALLVLVIRLERAPAPSNPPIEEMQPDQHHRR